jgi:uncharacterized protein YjbJ (UPF0337 family)
MDTQLKDNWQQLKERTKSKWDKFTDEDLDRISGDREKLISCIEDIYGISKEDATRQVQDWEKSHDRSGWDYLGGSWEQLKGLIQRQWGRLTNDDLDEIEGNRKLLIGKIQKIYGLSAEEAEQQVHSWNRAQGQPINWEKIQGNWEQFKGMVQRRWGKLTNDDLNIIQGNRKELEGYLQERYGIGEEEARRQIEQWEDAA